MNGTASATLSDGSANTTFYNLTIGDGSQLRTDNLTNNIPTATGRETGHGWVAYKTTGAAYTELLYIDYMSLSINRQLQR